MVNYRFLRRCFALAITVAALTSCESKAGNHANYELKEYILANMEDTEFVSPDNSGLQSEKEESVDFQHHIVEVRIGDSIFTAVFYDNEAARSLMEQMPLTFDMADLNRNEKFYYLSENLPVNNIERPSTINAGEIMCWSSNCLVLFYDTFPNSYGGYVRLGYIEDISGLSAALGTGSVQVTFSISSDEITIDNNLKNDEER